jgi:CRP/FNR family transcriptional regulator, cyclic AMP receptor protein
MNVAEVSGYLAAVLVFLTFYMKRMVPLRIIGICSNCAFVLYGYLGDLYPVTILHSILLPLNCLRLREMLQLTKQVREAARGDLNMDWLKPFTSIRTTQAGEVLFSKGDAANEMFVVLVGRYRLAETGTDIEPPQVVGEFGWVTPEGARTQTLKCVESGALLQIGYGQLEQLFFQNPKFGFAFLKLITRRLLQNIAQLEADLSQCQQARST